MAFSMRSLSVLAACAALMSSACVIRFGPIEDDTDWETTSQTTGGNEAGNGGGDEGGAGGVGGAGGAGGHGGSPKPDTSVSATSGGSGGNDSPYCTDQVGTGMTAEVCDTLAVAPSTSGMCEYHAPIGYLACQRAFEVFAPGQAEQLVSCLSNIQSYEACADTPVTHCVDNMYQDACTNTFVEDTCDSWGNICQADGQSFDVASCKSQLNPFGDEGLTQMAECMNEQTSCQAGYSMCLDEVLAL